jgi:hypothetical protein
MNLPNLPSVLMVMGLNPKSFPFILLLRPQNLDWAPINKQIEYHW